MCYHISLTTPKEEIEEKFDANFEALDIYQPTLFHFNGFGEEHLQIIRQDDYNSISPSYWGVMPEEMNIYQRTGFLRKTNTLNAKAENLFSSRLFNQFIHHQRCIIIADGFYEPHHKNGNSYPYYIRYKNKAPFAFAGIYSELDDDLYTASIITTLANPFMKEIHNKTNKDGEYRMPLILDDADVVEWLNPDLKEGDIEELLFTFTSEEMVAYPVSKDVFNSRVDSNRSDIQDEVQFDELNALF